ncbi:phosphoserine phosphatase [Apiospora rasikravindrae]|uniref:phosphoserine phosphatase n=1 Tax=Apiospora rasikravindrae TaxID=990691 RepID=A0ABR1S1Z7_9PEZI
MAEGNPATAHRQPPAARPQLGGMRSSSYLQEHQQYRGPATKPEGHFGIDTVVEDLQSARISPAKSFSPFNGVPSKEDPPRIVDGGSHDFTHPNCAAPRGQKTSKLIATLMYKANKKSTPLASSRASASNDNLPSPRLPKSDSDLPANMAPTTNFDDFPLEPRAANEPEPLDHLYGSYISPMCITSFLHLMSTFPLPPGSTEITSSHRCLDDPDHPLVISLSLADLRKHELIYRFEREWNIDVALQRGSLWRRHPRLVVFDMDSTLITQEVIDLLAATLKDPPDLAQQVADITHRAMLGELEFDAAFKERVQLLKGLPVSLFEQLRPILDVTTGVPDLIKALKRLGVKTAVLSGGFLPLTSWLAQELGIDYAHANEVELDDAGRFTGEVKGRIVGKERKRELLLEIAEKEGIALSQVVAVGDGANDLLMMDAAGLGVAWNAKPRVQMEACARLNGESLMDLLYLFGFTREDLETLVE